MASAKADKGEALPAPAPKAVFEALTNIHADGLVFNPGDCVDVCAETLTQLVKAGAVKEV